MRFRKIYINQKCFSENIFLKLKLRVFCLSLKCISNDDDISLKKHIQNSTNKRNSSSKVLLTNKLYKKKSE